MPDKTRSDAERIAAGVILAASARTLARMRLAAKAATADVADRSGASAFASAAVLGSLLVAGKDLASNLGDNLAQGRAEARVAARKRLAAELAGVGVTLTLWQPNMRRDAADAALSAIAAESAAAQWRAIAIAESRQASKSDSPQAVLARTRQAFDARMDRTSVTEVVHAYNEEHREAMRDLVRREPDLAERLMREWSAFTDGCGRCLPHDGERVRADEPFAYGDEPGLMHPRCMCVETAVFE